jgi:4,5-DOPA dioxygenase extradiol
MTTHKRMPALFVGHGSPMNAIEDNEFSRAWQNAGQRLPKPKAILCVSAHWETRGVGVTAMDRPRTIHDFGGFPPELFAMKYPAPGSPELAGRVKNLLDASGKGSEVTLDTGWGLDHGTWSVLCRMFPQAEIPVVQLSLDRALTGESHYELGKSLQPLRDEDILILGSGNIVHNLRMIDWDGGAFDWAVEFDRQARDWIRTGEHIPLIHYEGLGKAAALSINSAEHFKPLLYILGLQQPGDAVSFFAEGIAYGSLSMRCVQIGS